MKAIWNNTVIAESDDIEMVEGNAYFPADSVKQEYFEKSESTSTCPWKGTAHYYNVVIDGDLNRDAAWYYPEPKKGAERVKDRIAFWRGVEIEQ
jgi:uncharacterized protein (DUF427 family)